jgi:hypothetical protein
MQRLRSFPQADCGPQDDPMKFSWPVMVGLAWSAGDSLFFGVRQSAEDMSPYY